MAHHSAMDDLAIGRRIRAVRHRLGWRQVDVADRAGVSAATVGRIEHGQLSQLQLCTIRSVLRALEVQLDLTASWRGGEIDRVLDDGHAALAARIGAVLTQLGWVVQFEVSFSVYGERGSIDVLAWHAATGTLLVVEVKTSLNSVEQTLRIQDMKVRLAPAVASERFGWRPRATASLLVLPEDSTSRRRVALHAGVLDAAFPTRGAHARRWLSSPSGAASMLVHLTATGRRAAPRRRVRRRRGRRVETAC